MRNLVSIKGISTDTLEIVFDATKPYADIREALLTKLVSNKSFFKGASTKVILSGRSFQPQEKKELRELFLRNVGLNNIEYEENIKKQEKQEKKVVAMPERTKASTVELISNDYFDARSIIISHTLRSGQRVECEGDVVVLGDVNNGAEIVAGGSIIIMGTLRGLAHAGATGRPDVVIAANKLSPKQLRINAKIAIFPENNKPDGPECAHIVEGNIVIRELSAKRAILR